MRLWISTPHYGTSMRVRKAFNSEGTSTLDKATIAAPFTGATTTLTATLSSGAWIGSLP